MPSNVLQYIDDFAGNANYQPTTVITSLNMDLTAPCNTFNQSKALCLRDNRCSWQTVQVCKFSTQCANLNCLEPIDGAPYVTYTCSNCSSGFPRI